MNSINPQLLSVIFRLDREGEEDIYAVRGGSWNDDAEDMCNYVHSSRSWRTALSFRLGFRLAEELK